MRKSMAVVLGSIILTVSMVMVWPVALGSVAPQEGLWTGAESALAADEDPKPGWYEVGESESGRPIYRYYGKEGWDSFTTSDPLLLMLVPFIAQLLWGSLENTSAFIRMILYFSLIDPDEESEDTRPPSSPPTGEPAIALPATPSTASAGGSCEARFYHASPKVTVKGAGKAKPKLARADFWIDEDCSVRMELVWQARITKGWCHMLVAEGSGTSTPRRVFPQTMEITGKYDGGTSAIDEACPAKDCPGDIDWLLGGDIEAGQVGGYLSSAPAKVVAEVVEDGTLHVEPLTFKTGYMTFKVKRLFAEPQEPPPEPKGCPVD